MRILVAVSVRELKFVGVGFEKTRNLKLVTQNFFVPLHPDIGLRPFFLRFATKAAEPSAKPFGRFNALRAFNAASQRFNAYGCSSGLRPFKKVLSPLRYESGRAERNALRAFKWYKIEIS